MLPVRKPVYTPDEQVYLDWYNQWVPGFLYAGIGTAIVLLGLYNWLDRTLSAYYVRTYHTLRRPGSADRMGEPAWKWFPSALLAMYRKNSYKGNWLVGALKMRSTAQLGAVAGYWLLNILLASLGAHGQIDYIAHHNARLCNANIPLLVGLAAKEVGFVSWVTGFSFETLNVFHRWTARLFWVLSIVHFSGRIYVNDPPVDPSLPHSRYQAWGIAAFIFFTFMVHGSIRVIRDRWYKAFIFSHISCFALAVVCLSFHRPQVSAYVAFGAAIYMLDRLARGVSLVYWNLFKTIGLGQGPSARVEVLSPDCLKITFQIAMPWKPGQHIYLHAPNAEIGGHPFSVASTFLPITHLDKDPAPRSSAQVLIVRVRDGITRKIYDATVQQGAGRLAEFRADCSTFISAPLWPAWTEGPYGHNLQAHRYESVLLVTGGSGVTFALPLLSDLVRRARNEQLRGGLKTAELITKKLTWVWTVKDASHVEWVGDLIREAILYAPPDFLDMRIHVTGGAHIPKMELKSPSIRLSMADVPHLMYDESPLRASESTVASSSGHGTMGFSTSTVDILKETKGAYGSAAASVHSLDSVDLPLHSGRPDLARILDDVVQTSDYWDSVLVGTCGPAAMTKNVGALVSQAIDVSKVAKGEHRRNITLQTEAFGW